jgi:Flp pilus assembly protein TadG
MLLRVPTSASRRRRLGAATVEFALLVPFLCFIFVATVDFARIIYYTVTLDNCAHNGGVYGSQTYDNANQQWIGSMAQYWEGPNGKIVSTEQAAADVDGANLTPAMATSNVASVSSTDPAGNPTNVVTITYTFNTIVGFPGIPSTVTITRVVTARVAPAVPN